MSQDDGMDMDGQCQTCELAGEWCPAGMSPEGRCVHRRPTQAYIAERWWESLGDKDVMVNGPMFDD